MVLLWAWVDVIFVSEAPRVSNECARYHEAVHDLVNAIDESTLTHRSPETSDWTKYNYGRTLPLVSLVVFSLVMVFVIFARGSYDVNRVSQPTNPRLACQRPSPHCQIPASAEISPLALLFSFPSPSHRPCFASRRPTLLLWSRKLPELSR